MTGSPQRRDPGRRRPLILVVALALIVVVVALGFGTDRRAAASPDDWRIEQYREVTFQVPAHWGYGSEPGPDWCGRRKEQPGRKPPYVMLGSATLRLSIPCRPIPDSLIRDHAAVASADPRSWPEPDPRPDGLYRIQAGFWEAIRTVGSVRLRAISLDVGLAQQIVDSAAVADDTAPCRPDHPILTNLEVRPSPAGDVTRLGRVDRITLCQYEYEGVRATGVITGAEAQRLIDAVARAPVWNGPVCPAGEDQGAELAVVLRVQSDAGQRELILRQGSCASPSPIVTGGFDDGRTVRTATSETCRAVLVQGLILGSGSLALFERCWL
ncbi:hypothetical protein [Microlunatus sp. GCM10028923]|uniref:hypothetical protein n=1 Tax=Microlunatus sp. GCM10028923 TaxID=3273400 RepID=UPI00361080AA